jgi:archaellum component FlaG (FlaF/FlaG flagellin family)
MTVTVSNLDFSIVTNNDDMVQINVNKRSDCLPASIASAKWEMFFPNTRTVAVVKENADIMIVDREIDGEIYPDAAIKFMLEHTDTIDLPAGKYPHEATIITEDGRIHTVTQGDFDLTAGFILVRRQFTPEPT